MSDRPQPKPLNDEGYVIINPYNCVWHRGLFQTSQEAEDFLEKFWDDDIGRLKRFKVVKGRATFEAIP